MGLKIIISVFFILFAIVSLILYWFIPFGTNTFTVTSGNSNFSAITNSSLQFYPNMRYPDSKISYSIDDYCTLQKKNDMKRAFEIIDEKTLLNFYEVKTKEEISVTCNNKDKTKGGLFIAGEGGPTNITVAGKYNVIFHGKILLIRDSNCPNPNIALHELLHALGFAHSTNKNNVMYPVASCSQTIGDDVPNLINELYSIPSYPDLAFENVSAVMHGSYLDLNMTIRNNGLKDAGKSKVIFYIDGSEIKTFEIEKIEIGHGREISLANLWTRKRNAHKITLFINSEFSELNFENNEVTLQMQDN